MRIRTTGSNTRVVGAALAVALAATGALSACSSSSKSGSKVVVASAAFPENVLLMEIYAQALEDKGISVERKPNVGQRDVLFQQLKSNAITVVPEYNGALLAYLDKSSTESTQSGVDSAVTAKLPSNLQILNPAAAQDNDSLVVTQALATKDNLKKISDLAPYAKDLVLGSAPEFKTRQQGVLGLQSQYGLTFKDFKALDNSGPQTVSALQHGDADVVDLYSTTTAIKTNGFVVLDDDKGLFGVQNVIPLVDKGKLSPAGIDALNAVSAKLDTTTLTSLLEQVVTQKKDESDVAKAWLASVGLNK
ncbi:Substrate-binding region of ABC-type glycine betaine transport system [Catenulispora acidiphila DSM 44928]|uniref:Substrate-binding region of ABC-type glycine betaine transport system n=1 Tax=Catenulispora acidiphila (strain DSM 44928 / JCM 14897 / NBRC 102108 / NRRL B-24433 / ID139908) TaxID=479433 RepID=C7Q4M1_CATAD|nr:ABC transporter substrate-binding protein [Catenulispora acidiphila]ACU71990.1 Substrate-binding region of ABC-type glycine betaine transport system [Catenulispora acidiphila DSM 44928]